MFDTQIQAIESLMNSFYLIDDNKRQFVQCVYHKLT